MTVLMLTVDGGTLSYNVSGAGPPIVFVAGLGDRGTYWTAQVAAFSSAFQVVTFDHRGVGASEGQPPYKVEQWAADTLRLSFSASERCTSRWVLIGAARPGIRRRKSRRASMRRSLMTPENACGVSDTRRC